jgi:hypothetical protein
LARPEARPQAYYLVGKLHVQLLGVLLALLGSLLLGSDGLLQGLFVSVSLLLQFLQLFHDGLDFRFVLVPTALQVLREGWREVE